MKQHILFLGQRGADGSPGVPGSPGVRSNEPGPPGATGSTGATGKIIQLQIHYFEGRKDLLYVLLFYFQISALPNIMHLFKYR